jgi:hypothetical protein
MARECNWTQEGSIGGGSEDGDGFGDGVQRRTMVAAATACNPGEVAAMPGKGR